MPARVPFRLRRSFLGLAGAFALLLPACSGSGDVTGPEPEPPHPAPAPHPGPQPAPQPGPQPGPPPAPQPPPQPGTVIAGSYGLVRINESEPGQLVTLANPDGIVIGLYRFQASTSLRLDPTQTWSLRIDYSDDKNAFVLADEGEFAWTPDENGVVLSFESAVYGDAFAGKARDGLAAIRYDFDGDGQTETVFVFQRIGD